MRVAVAHSAGTLSRLVAATAALWLGAAANAAAQAPARFAAAIDGVHIDAEELRRHEPVEGVLARLRADWQAQHPDAPAIDATVGDVRLLGQRLGRAYRVAQLTDLGDGTTRVLLSTRELHALPSADGADLPLAAGSRVIRRLELAEGPQPVVQVYALALEPPRIAELRFDAAARRAGWDPGPMQHRRLATVVRAWRRGTDELLVVTTPIGRGTGFLLHLAPRAAAGSSP